MQPSYDTVVITGAGSGIGRALSLAVAPRCRHLVLAGRRMAPLEESRRLAGKAAQTSLVEADVTTAEGRKQIAAAAGGSVDVLINNAGVVHSSLLENQDDASFAAMLATNVAAPLALTRDLLPALRRARGRVVFVGSVFGDIGHPYFAAYSASKHGLRGLADALRRELAEDGISVTYGAPRATRTDATLSYQHLIGPLRMRVDTPEAVSRALWRGIDRRSRSVYPAGIERFFVAVQRIAPQLVDSGLAGLRQRVTRVTKTA